MCISYLCFLILQIIQYVAFSLSGVARRNQDMLSGTLRPLRWNNLEVRGRDEKQLGPDLLLFSGVEGINTALTHVCQQKTNCRVSEINNKVQRKWENKSEYDLTSKTYPKSWKYKSNCMNEELHFINRDLVGRGDLDVFLGDLRQYGQYISSTLYANTN